MIELLTQVMDRARAGEDVALCAIVGTHGSTPQRKGAVMLVLRDGKTLGTLGGGCVEAEVRVRAGRLMEEKKDALLTFRLDQDYGWDDGLVCGGSMDVAVQVMGPEKVRLMEGLIGELKSNRTARLVLEVTAESDAAARYEIEIEPPPRLIIAGAGHVGRALGRFASELGFGLTVIDDRVDYASEEWFPGAKCIVGEIDEELSRCEIDRRTYIVIVTRGHKNDGRALAAIVRSSARYIGLIGSKRKIHAILTELHTQGVPIEQLARVHAPIGLEIGAVTPAEIAVSIAGELIAIRRGRGDVPATPMKATEGQLRRWFTARRL
jgi:xanthine dehydrogenase accessory factor